MKVFFFLSALLCFGYTNNLHAQQQQQVQLYTLEVKATIVDIVCKSVDDEGDSEEVYGSASIIKGKCTENYTDNPNYLPTATYSGKNDWEVKREGAISMVKNAQKVINKTTTWTYHFPSSYCGDENQLSIAECYSDLNERDSGNADDQLGNQRQLNIIKFTEVKNIPMNQSKTFNFSQTHASGGTKLLVNFKVVVTKIPRQLVVKKQ